MSYADHDHRGEYAEAGHDHYDYAEKYHRHYDDESTVQGLRQDLSAAEARIHELEELRRGIGADSRMTDALMEITELRVLAIEAVLAARWPRSVLLRWRLARDLRASVRGYGPDVGTDFATRRSQAVGDGWVRPWRQQ